MTVYVNLLGQWTALTDDYNINGMPPVKFANDFFIVNEEYAKNPTICVTHNQNKYIIPIHYLQIENY